MNLFGWTQNPQYSEFFTKRNIFAVVILLIIIIAIPLGLYLNSQNQNPLSKASEAAIQLIEGNDEDDPSEIHAKQVTLRINLSGRETSPQASGGDQPIRLTKYCDIIPECDGDTCRFQVKYYKNNNPVQDSTGVQMQFEPESALPVCNTNTTSSERSWIALGDQVVTYPSPELTSTKSYQINVRIRDQGETVASCKDKVTLNTGSCTKDSDRPEGCNCAERAESQNSCYQTRKPDRKNCANWNGADLTQPKLKCDDNTSSTTFGYCIKAN